MKTSDSEHILNRTDIRGLRPLYVAARNGNKDVVKFLLSKGCNMEQRSRGETALACAARWGQYEIVKLMLEKEIDLELMQEALKVSANHKIKQLFYEKGCKEPKICCELV